MDKLLTNAIQAYKDELARANHERMVLIAQVALDKEEIENLKKQLDELKKDGQEEKAEEEVIDVSNTEQVL